MSYNIEIPGTSETTSKELFFILDLWECNYGNFDWRHRTSTFPFVWIPITYLHNHCFLYHCLSHLYCVIGQGSPALRPLFGNSVWLVCDWTVTVQVAWVPVVKYCFSWRYWFRSGQQSMECLRWVSCSVVLVVRFISVTNAASLVQYITRKRPSSRHLHLHASGRFSFRLYSKATCCTRRLLPFFYVLYSLYCTSLSLSLSPSHFLFFSSFPLYIFHYLLSPSPPSPLSNFVPNRPGFSGQWHCSSVPDGHLSDWDMQSF